MGYEQDFILSYLLLYSKRETIATPVTWGKKKNRFVLTRVLVQSRNMDVILGLDPTRYGAFNMVIYSM